MVDVGLLVKREFNVLRTDNKLFRGDPIKRIKGDTFLRKLWRHIRVAGWVEGGGGGLRDNLALSTESRMGIGHRKKISTVSIDSFDDFP